VRWLFATFFQKGARFHPVFFLPTFSWPVPEQRKSCTTIKKTGSQ
jgi:hypothetical protein